MARVTMLAELSENMTRSVFWLLRINAPILVAENSLLYGMLAGIGLTLKGIQYTGEQQLAKRGLKPVDLDEDQARVIRDQIDKPDCDPELRDALLHILGTRLTEQPPAPVEDFPADGFVIGEDEQG